MLEYLWLHMYTSCRLPTETQEPPPSGPFYTTEGVLNLEQATLSDSGIYTCVGTNILGQSSQSTTITIITTQGACLN